jgi:hypothetical protein
MYDQRPERESMSIEAETVSNIWEIAAFVEVLERKGLCRKQDRHDIMTGFRHPEDGRLAGAGATGEWRDVTSIKVTPEMAEAGLESQSHS